MDKETLPATNDRQSVDFAVLRGLREIATPDQVDELIDLFLDTLEGNLTSMRAAMAKQDTTTLAKLAHGSKGTAAGMGATFLAALSHELQGSAKRGMLEEIYTRFKQMESETQCVRQIFEKEKTQSGT
jgi:HPt (histidine-containing phosphotransfer) domain-containing protein